jgi:hypothetical protein
MTPGQWTSAGTMALVCLGCARPPAETRSAPDPAPRVVPSPPGPTRDERVEQALARAPQLSRAAAEMLVDASERRGGIWGDPADASLIEANRGFAQMAPGELAELGALFGEAYATLAAADRASVEGYVERLRRGDSSDADERPRALLAQAVKSLPDPSRARLQALLESAIRSGLETERRTALAQRVTPLPPLPATRPAAWARHESEGGAYHRPAEAPATRDHEDEDARLRALGASYKSQLQGLEESVRYAERGVEHARQAIDRARATPLSHRPMGDPEVASAEQRLNEAQEALRRARNALDDLHTQIRRERVPYSYVQ